jgi:hypothetical protein
MEGAMEVSTYLEQCQTNSSQWAAVPVPLAASFLGLTREAIGERIRRGTLESVTVRGKERSWKLVLVSSLVHSTKEAKAHEVTIDDLVTGFLEDAARLEATVNYGTLMEKVGMSYSNPQHRRELGAVLARISKNSLDDPDRRFMLTALAIRKGTQFPNEAFFELAISLGQMDEHDDPEDYWDNQLDQIFRHYGRGK